MHTIRTRPFTYFAGKIPDGKQVLLGWVSDFLGILLFDSNGELLEARKHPLDIDFTRGLGPTVEAKVMAVIRDIQNQLGFRRASIRVKSFFIGDWDVGIKLFPLDLEDFLNHPDRYPEEDQEIYLTDIENWKKEGNCILKWGNDYYLGNNGLTL